MAKPPPKYVGDAAIQSLLSAHGCPLPFSEVRARIMGAIASPLLSASPLKTIEGLWQDGLPVFDSMEDANAIIEGLMGFWNHLAQHQKRSKPFKLTVSPIGDDREQMKAFLAVRVKEIGSFLTGLHQGAEDLPVPGDIQAELDLLHQNIGLLLASHRLLEDPSTSATEAEIKGLAKNLRELDRIAVKQVNDIIIACVNWRRHGAPRTIH